MTTLQLILEETALQNPTSFETQNLEMPGFCLLSKKTHIVSSDASEKRYALTSDERTEASAYLRSEIWCQWVGALQPHDAARID